MTIQLKHLLLILGGTLLAVGLLLGFLPAKSGGVHCGTAFTGQSDDAAISDLTSAMIGRRGSDAKEGCADTLSGRRTTALALTIPGLILTLAGASVGAARHPQETQDESTRNDENTPTSP